MNDLIIAISERALFRRIDRAVRREDECQRLRKMRGDRAIAEFGWFTIWDYRCNYPIAIDVCLQTLGRELGVLGEHQDIIWEE